MKVRTNEALIANRQRLGRWAAFGGLAVLLAGLLLSFRAPNSMTIILMTYVALIVGMLLSSIGIYIADKWVQEPRADQALGNALKGFGKEYRLYNYLLPAEHLLCSPYGLTVLIVKRHGDRVRYQDGTWKHEQSLLRRLQSLSRERLGNPIREMEREIDQMAQLVEKHLPGARVPIGGVIVFTNPDVALELDGAPADVLYVKKLKSYIRRADHRGSRMDSDTLRKLENLLDSLAQQQGA